jgi:hypothetical protein
MLNLLLVITPVLLQVEMLCPAITGLPVIGGTLAGILGC